MLKCRFLGPQEVWNKVSAFPHARDDSDAGHIWPTLWDNDLEIQSHNSDKLYILYILSRFSRVRLYATP